MNIVSEVKQKAIKIIEKMPDNRIELILPFIQFDDDEIALLKALQEDNGERWTTDEIRAELGL